VVGLYPNLEEFQGLRSPSLTTLNLNTSQFTLRVRAYLHRDPSRDSGHQSAEIIMPDNGICERFHRTVLDEFYRIAFRKKIYRTVDELPG
jgi:hypothetical protein